jgi:hypothetical protein
LPVSADTEAASKVKEVSGSFTVSGTFQVSKGLPDGTQVTVGTFATLTGDSVYSGSAGVDGATATVSGGRVSFTGSIPYAWLVTSTADTVTVELNLGGSATEYEYSSYLTQTIALPKNGATTPVKFTGSL